MAISAPLMAAIGLGGASTAGAVAGGSFLKVLSTVATIGSTAVSAAAAIQQGKTAEANAEYMEEAARKEVEAGERDSDRQRLRGAKLMGEQKVKMAANGIDLGSDAALDVLDDTKTLIEEDAFSIREGAYNDATGSLRQAANYKAEANMAPLNAGGLILGGASKVASRWDSWKDYEVPS